MDSIAVGGDGVARDGSGRVVFVPRAAPGDSILAELRSESGSFARARLVRVCRPGPERTRPACPRFVRCGGCQLQHLTRRGQLEARRRAVTDALSRIGGMEIAVPPPVVAGPALGYRNRVSFSLRRHEGRVTAGYRRFGAANVVLDIAECPLAEPPVQEAWGRLREAWGPMAGALPGGGELRLTLRASVEGRVGLLVRGGAPDRPGQPERVVSALPLESYWWRDKQGRRRHLGGAPTLRERWGDLDLELLPEAFLQPNRSVAAAMDEYLGRLLGPPAGRRLLDLYAGIGSHSLGWVRSGGTAVAYERNRDALRTGRTTARRMGVAVTFVPGRLEAGTEPLPEADVILANPPRAGLARRVARRLKSTSAAGLVYVSCDPATLARDVARLMPHWRLLTVQPFDAFPHTAHVETIAWMVRDRVAGLSRSEAS
ncbi:MAG: class I SAM-dependent RNA methyltransferase [Gemmatimonadota bacterium]